MSEHLPYIGHWVKGTGAEADQYQVDYLLGETEEFLHEWHNGQDRDKMVAELADVVVCAMGLIYLLGNDAETAVLDKVSTNYIKYPPEALQELLEGGMSRPDAMAYMKELWKLNNPT